MLDNYNAILKELGFNPNNLTMMDSIIKILHLIPALIKDGHIISYGEAGIGKTTLIERSSQNCTNITKVSSASLFGDKKLNQKGEISDKNDVVYFEQASKISVIENETMANILTHCNGDEVKRLNESYSNRTSIVLLGNCDSKYVPILQNPYPTFDENFFEKFPDEIKKIQGLERFIILPSFLMEKVNVSTIANYENNNNNKLTINRIDIPHYKLDKSLNIREVKEISKIIATLNHFLSKESFIDENDWQFKGFKAIAESITKLKKGKYVPFYYKNEDGRKLAIVFLKNYLPKECFIEEVHFLEHRALIKIEKENNWYKIALDIIGKLENEIEFEYFHKIKSNNIANIIEISSNKLILKQEYIPICSEYLKLKDLSSIYDSNFLENKRTLKENKELKDKVKNLENEIDQLKITINKVIIAIDSVKNNHLSNFLLPQFLEKTKTSKINLEIMKNGLCSVIPNLTLDKVKNRNIGIKNQRAYFLNFAEIINERKDILL